MRNRRLLPSAIASTPSNSSFRCSSLGSDATSLAYVLGSFIVIALMIQSTALQISTLSNTPSATFDTRLGEAARSAARTLACITRAIFDTIASPLPRGLNPYPIGPGIDGCKDAWIGVAASGHVVISSQQAPDAAFMSARYHVAPNGAVAAELSYMNGAQLAETLLLTPHSARPILALVSTYGMHSTFSISTCQTNLTHRQPIRSVCMS